MVLRFFSAGCTGECATKEHNNSSFGNRSRCFCANCDYRVVYPPKHDREPIENIRLAIDKVAQGDLSETIKVKAKNELGEVAADINRMIFVLRNIAQSSQEAATKLSSSITNLAALSEESSASVEELTAQSNEITNNAEVAYSSIQDFVSGVSQVSQTAQSIAVSTQQLPLF